MHSSTFWTPTFWKQVAERAIFVLCFTSISLLTADGADLISTNWLGVLSTVGMATLLSVLKSVAVGLSPIGEPGTPSLVRTGGRHAAQ